MTANETAYRQLIANPAVDMYGPQAEALQAEAKRLRIDFNRVYSTNAAQRATAAPAATLGVGAGINASTSALPLPLLPRLAPGAPIVPVETFDQRKDRCQKRLTEHWR